MVGKFVHMHTLNLDFSSSLSGFREDCFSCMPNLRLLSLCDTRITNLWTTSAALAKLPSLDELRFQNCLYRSDAGAGDPSALSSNEGIGLVHTDLGLCIELPSSSDEVLPHLQLNFHDEDLDDYDMVPDIRITNDESSDDSEVDFSGHHQDFGPTELYPDMPGELADSEKEVLNVLCFANMKNRFFTFYYSMRLFLYQFFGEEGILHAFFFLVSYYFLKPIRGSLIFSS